MSAYPASSDPAYPPPKGGPPPPAYSAPPPGYGYGQPSGYGQPPGYGQPANTVVVTQPVIATTVLAQQYRESPVSTVCPHCNASIVTATSSDVGSFAWLICVIIFLVGCWLGCCFIPFCVDSCKDVIHTCPNCKREVGRYNRL